MNKKLPFEEGYFINSKISNYEDYRKKKFESLAIDLIEDLKLRKEMRILDFGCATGGLLFEFKKLGFNNLKGTDISYWAIDYGKATYDLGSILEYFNVNLLISKADYLLLLDVLEHIPAITEIERFLNITRAKKIVVRIPVSKVEGEPFVLDVSRNDPTHVQCHDRLWWKKLFAKYNFYLIKTFSKSNTKSIYDSDGVFAGVFEKIDRNWFKRRN